MSQNEPPPLVSNEEPTLSTNLGALAASIVMFFGGGLLASSGWGKAAEIGGGLLGILGFITGGMMLRVVLGSLWRGDFRRR